MKRSILALLLAALLLCGCDKAPAPAADGTLTVHFIDVGQADCALLECGDEFMLIDGGNVADSDLVVSSLEDQGVEELKSIVCTHAHEDHVGGLAAVLAVYPTETVYAPTRTYSSRCFDDFCYDVDQQGLEITIPQPGDELTLGGTQLTVLGPLHSYPETNNTSIVLRAQFGDTRFLFTGDMEAEAEDDLLDSHTDLKADVLKVGHHGSHTSTGYHFLYQVDPDYAVISCGRDNDYGHTHREVVSRLNDADVMTYRTDKLGTILAVSDGTTITFTWEQGQQVPQPSEYAEQTFIGNKNSKKFHLPSCSNRPGEKNQVYFDSYEEAIAAGYEPCGNCLP